MVSIRDSKSFDVGSNPTSRAKKNNTMESRFFEQINNGNNPLIAFIKIKETIKLIELTIKEFDLYEIDKLNDIHKCIVPVIRIK